MGSSPNLSYMVSTWGELLESLVKRIAVNELTLLLLLLLLSHFSRVRLCATPWMAAHEAPPSVGFSRQEYWSGLPFPSPISIPQNNDDSFKGEKRKEGSLLDHTFEKCSILDSCPRDSFTFSTYKRLQKVLQLKQKQQQTCLKISQTYFTFWHDTFYIEIVFYELTVV